MRIGIKRTLKRSQIKRNQIKRLQSYRWYCLVFLLFSVKSFASLQFERIGADEGIASEYIWELMEDHKGNLWIGTMEGLSWYDGKHALTIKKSGADISGIDDNLIREIHQTSDRSIWVMTHKGVNLLKPDSNQFVHFEDLPTAPYRSLFELQNGKVIVSSTKGFYLLDPSSLKVLKQYDNSLTGDVRKILRWQNEWLFSSPKGVFRWSTDTEKFQQLVGGKAGVESPPVMRVVPLSEKRFLLTTLGQGLWLWHYDDEVNHIQPLLTGNTDFDTSDIFNVVIENGDILWIGSDVGLYRGVLKGDKLSVEEIAMTAHGVEAVSTSDVLMTSTGELAIATEKGIFITSPTQYYLSVVGKPELTKPVVRTVLQDDSNQIWVATLGGGVSKFSKDWRLLDTLTTEHPEYPLLANTVQAIHLDSQNTLWIGTDGGLSSLNLNTGQFVAKHELDNFVTCAGYKRDVIHSIVEDRQNNRMLFGGIGLLHVREQNSGTFNTIKGKRQPNSLPCGQYIDLQTGNGKYYIAGISRLSVMDAASLKVRNLDLKEQISDITAAFISFGKVQNNRLTVAGGAGLLKINLENDTVTPIAPKALSGRFFSSVLEDESGYWLGSTKGLLYLDKNVPDKARIYSRKDGLPSEQFSLHAAYLLRDGGRDGLQNEKLAFGTENGVIIFDKNKVPGHESALAPQINYWSVRKQRGEEHNIAGLMGDLSNEVYVFPYDTSGYEFWLTTHHWLHKKNYLYSYRLKGYSNEWANIPKQTNRISYSFLPTGQYELEVKIQSPTGLTTQPHSLARFEVEKTWWLATPMILLYVAMLFFVIWVAVWLRTRMIRRANVLLSSKVESQTAHLAKQANQLEQQKNQLQKSLNYKEDLLANISHELKTPLTLMTGIIESENSHIDKPLSLKKLIHRISRLMDNMRMLSSDISERQGEESYNYQVNEFVEFYYATYCSLVNRERLSLTANDDVVVSCQVDALDKIITNLINNAIKYSPPETQIQIISECRNNCWEFSVINEGKGILAEQLDSIFLRYVQLGESNNTYGLGLGLPLVKSLVEQEGGQIKVVSEPNVRTKVTVSLPLVQAVDDVKGIKADTLNEEYRAWIMAEIEFSEVSDSGDDESEIQQDELVKPLLFCIDDNKQLLDQLRDQLSGKFMVRCFLDPKQALQEAIECIPDIIISDIMMPQMDGHQLLKEVRQQELLSHIPVVLLTAKADRKSQMSGLSALADDYIIKPYDSALLNAKLENVLGLRALLKARYGLDSKRNQPVESQQTKDRVCSALIAGNEKEKSFMQKVVACIEQNLSDPSFNVKQLSEQLFLSASQLRRKVKAISGYSPKDTIRIMRLETAAEMIRKGESLKSISFNLGFSSQSHMGTQFRAYFGVTPKQYYESAELPVSDRTVMEVKDI
ncbi:ATP-binding protein [Aliikangiella sp. IMCC44359]|uniref:ATP-binding protein n=1 Tax=Aliikangiella sp. IMCC44359 TaxID=3459125 RepID=UPI00403B125C